MPTLWAAGVEGAWDYLAIDLLGASLDSLYRKSGKDIMELSSVCSIAMQVVSRDISVLFKHMFIRYRRYQDSSLCTVEAYYTETFSWGIV